MNSTFREAHRAAGMVPSLTLVEHGDDGVVEGRKQQRIIEERAVGFPHRREEDDDRSLADKTVVPQQLRHAELALDLGPIAGDDGVAAEQNSRLAHCASP